MPEPSDSAIVNEPALAPRRGGRGWLWPGIATLVVLVLTVAALRGEGRVWRCKQGDVSPWISNVWSPHCSQHVADPYSITHVSHGLIFFFLFAWIGRRWSVGWRFFAAVTLAAAWEVVENSPFIINRYREATMSLDYLGDSVINALGDVLSCALGFALARWLGLWRSLALFVVTELALLWLMRDNLTLNVVMLVWPIQAIKVWQSAGH